MELSLLIWSAVGAAIMNIHYRLFKHVSWYSEMCEEGYTAFNVCPGCKPERNPAILALTAIANIVFDPNGFAKSFLGPIYFFFGATVQGQPRVLASFQRELARACCKLWRSSFIRSCGTHGRERKSSTPKCRWQSGRGLHVSFGI